GHPLTTATTDPEAPWLRLSPGETTRGRTTILQDKPGGQDRIACGRFARLASRGHAHPVSARLRSRYPPGRADSGVGHRAPRRTGFPTCDVRARPHPTKRAHGGLA